MATLGLSDGTESEPSLYFVDDEGTGFYRRTPSGRVAFTHQGQQVFAAASFNSGTKAQLNLGTTAGVTKCQLQLGSTSTPVDAKINHFGGPKVHLDIHSQEGRIQIGAGEASNKAIQLASPPGGIKINCGMDIRLQCNRVLRIQSAGVSKKIAFFDGLGQAQVNHSGAAASFSPNSSGIDDDSATWGGYTMGQIVLTCNVSILPRRRKKQAQKHRHPHKYKHNKHYRANRSRVLTPPRPPTVWNTTPMRSKLLFSFFLLVVCGNFSQFKITHE